MAIDIKKESTQKWILAALIPVLMGLVGGFSSGQYNDGKDDERMDNLEKAVDAKADIKDIDFIKEQLMYIREDQKEIKEGQKTIEAKIDNHMSNDRKN